MDFSGGHVGRNYKLWHDLSDCLVVLHIGVFVWGSRWLSDKDWADQFFSINHSTLLSTGAVLGRPLPPRRKISFPSTWGLLFPPLNAINQPTLALRAQGSCEGWQWSGRLSSRLCGSTMPLPCTDCSWQKCVGHAYWVGRTGGQQQDQALGVALVTIFCLWILIYLFFFTFFWICWNRISGLEKAEGLRATL